MKPQLFLNAAHGITADFYIGSLSDERSSRGKFEIAFGNCVPEDESFDLRIKRCPPYPFALKSVLKIFSRSLSEN